MLFSSGVVWRYRSLEDFRRECPTGDAGLQRQIVERLDEALEWLESLGAPVLRKETGNPRTAGWRFDPRGLTEALVSAAGGVELGRVPMPGTETGPLVLATGGFGVRLARERGLAVRSNPWSSGDGLDLGLDRGAAATNGMDEFYGRAMPAPPARWGEAEYVDHAQLYGRFAQVLGDDGEPIRVDPGDWSENGLVQEIGRHGGLAWYVVAPADLDRQTPYGTVAEVIERVRRAGARVEERDEGAIAVRVVAAVTHTIGGLATDERARVVGADGLPIDGLYAAGVDAGGWSTGGYASGLAAALVFGRTAAEEIAGADAT
jgi:succinate dehydrogenase/fumarate reductase flavoprotein subunit